MNVIVFNWDFIFFKNQKITTVKWKTTGACFLFIHGSVYSLDPK